LLTSSREARDGQARKLPCSSGVWRSAIDRYLIGGIREAEMVVAFQIRSSCKPSAAKSLTELRLESSSSWPASITTRKTSYLTSWPSGRSWSPLIGAKSTLVNFPSLNRGFTPGQHVRVRLLVPSLWSSALESHPFTIASAEGHSVNLIVKAAGDWTNSLYDLSLSNKQMRCTIEGPYGGPLNFLFPAFRSVMIIVGGSGSKSI
jgi:hypothetical protein